MDKYTEKVKEYYKEYTYQENEWTENIHDRGCVFSDYVCVTKHATAKISADEFKLYSKMTSDELKEKEIVKVFEKTVIKEYTPNEYKEILKKRLELLKSPTKISAIKRAITLLIKIENIYDNDIKELDDNYFNTINFSIYNEQYIQSKKNNYMKQRKNIQSSKNIYVDKRIEFEELLLNSMKNNQKKKKLRELKKLKKEKKDLLERMKQIDDRIKELTN